VLTGQQPIGPFLFPCQNKDGIAHPKLLLPQNIIYVTTNECSKFVDGHDDHAPAATNGIAAYRKDICGA
jgi:hypothetical protein